MDKFYTTKDIAQLFKVKEITVRRWINKEWLSAIKIGKMYHIKKQDLEKFIENGEKKVL
jgi:excisionase family DNA binding protein